MTTWRAIDEHALEHLLGSVGDGSWSWSVHDVPRFAADRGWTVVESVPGKAPSSMPAGTSELRKYRCHSPMTPST